MTVSPSTLTSRYRQRPATVIAPIKAGQEQPLYDLLTAINSDIKGNPYIRFDEDLSTHFARWFILRSPCYPPRLVFAATYNGGLDDYVTNLVQVSPGLDDIWGKCEGYSGSANFHDFVRRYFVPSPYSFAAYPFETPESIRNKIAVRRELESSLDLAEVVDAFPRQRIKPFLRQLALAADPLPILERFVLWRAARGAAAVAAIRGALVPLALRATQIYSQFGEPKEYPKLLDIYSNTEKRQQYLQLSRDLADNASSYAQNQFTVAAPIVAARLSRLRLALFLGGFLAGYGYPPGELTGVFTIHSLHWVIIDEGRTGIVMSNYDGSWENYLGDFADKLNFGLDALFNNCADYPPGGLHRPEAWAEWIRSAQLVVPLYYSAYPDETAVQVGRDRDISAAASAHDAPSTAANVIGLL